MKAKVAMDMMPTHMENERVEMKPAPSLVDLNNGVGRSCFRQRICTATDARKRMWTIEAMACCGHCAKSMYAIHSWASSKKVAPVGGEAFCQGPLQPVEVIQDMAAASSKLARKLRLSLQWMQDECRDGGCLKKSYEEKRETRFVSNMID